MPRDVTVTFADGSQHVYRNAPDELTPEQVTARAQQEFNKPVQSLDGGKSASIGDTVKSAVRSGIAGFGKAAAMAPEALGMVFGLQAEMKPLADTVRQYWTDFGDKSSLKGYGKAVAEGVGGALTSPVGGLAQTVVPAATGAVGSEAAARTFGDSPSTRFLGGLAGGFGGAAALSKLTTPRVQESSIAKEAMEGITEKQLAAAQAMQERAAKLGVKLDLAQALTATGASPTNLHTVRDLIANTKEGNKTQTLLRNQPTEVNEATRFAAEGIPGRDYGLEQAANNVQEAATNRVKQVTQERTNAVRADYAKAGMLPEAAQRAVVQELQATLKTPGLSDEARGVATELLARFQNAPQSVDSAAQARAAIAAAQKPSQKLAGMQKLADANNAQTSRPIHALDADTAISDAVGSFKGSPTYLANPKASGQVKGMAARVNDLLKEGSPEIAAAEAKFANISADLVNPVKQGPVGQFATPRGYLPDRAASTSKLAGLFDNGVSPSAPTSPIRVLGKELGKADPEAFQDGFKAWLTSKIDKHAASDLTAGQAQPDALAKGLYEELFRSPKRYQGIKDAVATIAEQNGQNPAEVVKGLDNLGMVLKGAANRPMDVKGVSQEQLQQLAGHSLSANALRVFGFLPFERAARWREGTQAAQTFRTFDELLTSPEGAATLARLAKTSPMSPAFANTLQGFEAGLVQSQLSQGRENNTPGITR